MDITMQAVKTAHCFKKILDMSNITYIWANSNRLQQEKVYLKTQSGGEDDTIILSAALWTFRRVGRGVGQANSPPENPNK